MATQFYLQLDGVKGDSQDAGHKDWMDVDNWNIGAHHPSGIKAGGGGSTGKTSFTDLNFTTHLCPASVDMFLFRESMAPQVKHYIARKLPNGDALHA